MTVIFDQEIKRRVRDENLVENCLEKNVWGASYDMRLGQECAKDGVIIDLEKSNTLSLLPGEFARNRSLPLKERRQHPAFAA